MEEITGVLIPLPARRPKPRLPPGVGIRSSYRLRPCEYLPTPVNTRQVTLMEVHGHWARQLYGEERLFRLVLVVA